MGTVTAKDLIQDMKTGKIQIPSFQRDFVWKRQEVVKLLESIRLGIPIGTITLWEPPVEIRPKMFEHIFKGQPVRRLKTNDWIEGTDSSQGVFEIEAANIAQPETNTNGPIYGVIDGRQRLTSLLMLFGGVAYARSTQLGGLWALNLKVDIDGDDSEPFEFFDWKKCDKFRTPMAWLSEGYFPLWLHEDYQQAIDALDFDWLYASQADKIAAKKLWRRNLNRLNDVLNTLSLEEYVLGARIGLDKVCVVFETINNRGVKVGVYDIVHASLMGRSSNSDVYDLKQTIKDISESTQFRSLASWFDENDGKGDIIVPQLAMARKMGMSMVGAETTLKLSFKGPDLIDAVDVGEYKECFDTELDKLEGFANDFRDLVCVDSRRASPYPILFPVYCILRWAQISEPVVPREVVNQAFKLFFWRACLCGRYDQGFLTRAYVDARTIWSILSSQDQLDLIASGQDRWMPVFLNQMKSSVKSGGLGLDEPNFDDIKEALKFGASGALDKALKLVIRSRSPLDIKTRAALTDQPGRGVQLHHIFPDKWIRKNRKAQDSQKYVPGISILVPLSDESNREWLEDEPRQRLTLWQGAGPANGGPDWDSWKEVMESLLVDEDCFNELVSTSTDNVERFIEKRTESLVRVIKVLVGKPQAF